LHQKKADAERLKKKEEKKKKQTPKCDNWRTDCNKVQETRRGYVSGLSRFNTMQLQSRPDG
jgi:hypothetical protein